METINITYQGNLRTDAVHIKSQHHLQTDAPTDNQGKGEAFSPTDLLAASLGCCMMTIMGITARKNNINIEGITAKVTKIMEENPRRVAEVIMEFDMSKHTYSPTEKEMLETAARNCPVAKSLHHDLKQTLVLKY